MPKLLSSTFNAVPAPRPVGTVSDTVVVVFALSGLVGGQSRNAFHLLLGLGVYLGISPINVVLAFTNWKDLTRHQLMVALATDHHAVLKPTLAPAITTTRLKVRMCVSGSYGACITHHSGLTKGERSLSLAVYKPPCCRAKTQISAPVESRTTARCLENSTSLLLSQIFPHGHQRPVHSRDLEHRREV